MPAFKEIDLKFVENEFKHSKITAIKHKNDKLILSFDGDHLHCHIALDDSNKRIEFYFEYKMFTPMTINSEDDIQHRIESYVARKLSKLISIPQYSHRYYINIDMLHRFLSWDESDDYHKIFKLKSLTKFKDFKYILKHWSNLEQYFRTNLWSRQCLISFIASRNKWHLLAGEHEWIIHETLEFWLHSFHIYSIEEDKRKLNTYFAIYGTKQNTRDVFHAMYYGAHGILNISSSINSLNSNFIQQFDIRFSKKSKYSSIGIHRLLKVVENKDWIHRLLVNNADSIIGGLELLFGIKENGPNTILEILNNSKSVYEASRESYAEYAHANLLKITSFMEKQKLMNS